jgi:transcriptional regulator with GAF, ATPase, and Fis domain
MAEKSINSNSKDNKLISLFEATAKETGKKFFEALILNLANALNTYGAWANVYNEDQSKAKSLAFLIAGELLPDFEYEIKGTPCETVINNDTLHHVPDNLIEIYPDDPEIKEGLKKPLSYLGVPIKDNSGNIIGNLGVLDCEPMPANPRSLEIFNLFASRATAELQRLKADIQNKEREEKIERLLDSTMEAIIELDQDLTVNMVNASAERMFLCPSNHFIGKNFSEFLSNESAEQLSSLKSQLNSFPVGKRHLTVNNGLNVRKVDETSLKVEASLSEFYLGSCIYYTLILKDTQDTGDNIKFFNQCKYETAVFNDNIRETTVSNEITSASMLMLKLLEDIKKVAPTGSTVLITGETGTGKELIARAIHNQSGNNNAPLIKVNCAAIPASLIESEFFGHEKGAFTGATSKRKGRFSLADGGTIFLDEIGELPLELQSKLLRVLQEGEFEPVGGSETIKVDVRVVTATNRNLSEEVKKGTAAKRQG